MSSKGTIDLVHLYPREMSIYGDLGNTRCLAQRIRRHGYDVRVHNHDPGATLPETPHLFMGGGGQDSGQSRVEDDLAVIADRLRDLAADGTPMIMICGMYQLFGNAFITVEGQELPGLGILDVTTQGNAKRMIGPVVLDTAYGDVVGYENHSGSTVLGAVSGVSVYLRSARPRRSVDSAFATSWCSTGRAALRRWLSADFSGPVRPGSRSMQRCSSPAQRAH